MRGAGCGVRGVRGAGGAGSAGCARVRGVRAGRGGCVRGASPATFNSVTYNTIGFIKNVHLLYSLKTQRARLLLLAPRALNFSAG